MNANAITAGTIAIVKVGRNEVEVEVLEAIDDSYKVKSISTNREFKVRKILRIVSQPEAKQKKTSLLEAAAQVLKGSGQPLNSKEMVAKAIELALWIPTAAKTPEQSLYSAIFREMKSKENPRFRKSTERKGAFEYVG
jgi:hypothetical protein